MNKYKIDYEYTENKSLEMFASDETEAEDLAFEIFDKDELIAPMITKVTELE